MEWNLSSGCSPFLKLVLLYDLFNEDALGTVSRNQKVYSGVAILFRTLKTCSLSLETLFWIYV